MCRNTSPRSLRRELGKAIRSNVWKLAPDRFLTVFGILLTTMLLVTIMLGSVVAAMDFHDIERLDVLLPVYLHAIQLVLAASVAVWSVIWTERLCRHDPELYSRMVTEDVKSRLSLYFLCNEAIKIIDSITPNILDVKEHPTLVKLNFDEHMIGFKIIEETKSILAPRFGLSTRVFCDQFFRFSPSVFRDRVRKLSYNYQIIKDATSKTSDKRAGFDSNTLDKQSERIEDWLRDLRHHLESLRDTSIDFDQVIALFMAKSTTGSVEVLAKILQEQELEHSELYLLFNLLGAYRGRSLFRRLLAATILQHDQSRTSGAPIESAVLKHRTQVLLTAACKPQERESQKNEKQAKPSLQEIYDSDSLTDWWEDVSEFIKGKRSAFTGKLAKLLLNQYQLAENGETFFIVLDSYSRALKTTLREIWEGWEDPKRAVEFDVQLMPDFNPDRVVVFVLASQEVDDFDSRLMHHALLNEMWPSSMRRPSVVTGDLQLLTCLVAEGDQCAYLTGAAATEGKHHIYTTTNPALVDSLEELFTEDDGCTKPENGGSTKSEYDDLARTRRFTRTAVAGSYKVKWNELFEDIGSHLTHGETKKTINELGLSKDTLLQDRDSLTGGLYRLRVDEIVSK